MSNTCGCSNNSNNNRSNSNCGCCNLLNEFANALNNLFTDPCNCGCGCNRNAWRNGFINGWNARRNNSGCGCQRTYDLSNLTNCGNYDEYYARQYGLTGCGCSCSL